MGTGRRAPQAAGVWLSGGRALCQLPFRERDTDHPCKSQGGWRQREKWSETLRGLCAWQGEWPQGRSVLRTPATAAVALSSQVKSKQEVCVTLDESRDHPEDFLTQNLTVNFNYLETPGKRKRSKAPFYELAFWVSQKRAAFSKPAVVSSLMMKKDSEKGSACSPPKET